MICLLAMIAATALPVNPATQLWFTTPAHAFTESSVLGNGRLGAMVFGDPADERVVLNESTMWSGSPQDADREDAYKVLPEIRRLLLAGENKKAQELLQANFVCKGPGSGNGGSKDGPYGCYQIFGNLRIKQSGGAASDYRRILDLDDAVTTVDYSKDGNAFHREAFVSAPAQVIVYRLTSKTSKGLSFALDIDRPENAVKAIEGNDLVLKGQLKSGNPAYQGVKFEGRVRILSDGAVTHNDGLLKVEDASNATILVSAGTSMFDNDFEPNVLKHLDNAASQSYDQLKREHIKDHQKFFHRVTLNLLEGPSAHLPTLDRLKASSQGEDDPSLATLYFNYGRYLLIGSSRPDSPLPANLQGIWAEELLTPWNGDFHLDINLQMNYWPVEECNLSDCAQPLLNFVPRLVENGHKTAQAYYRANGWVAHVITNPWLFTSPGEGADWGSTCTCGAWLCEHLWQHYRFTQDHEYLKSAYPVLKGAAQFFLDMLIEEPSHGWLVTAPSNSPENQYIDPKDGPLSTCMGPTIDIAIVRELFTNTIAASETLGTDKEFRDKLAASRSKLAPYQIGKYGQIQEWLQDYEENEVHHRHVSPLYGLHPAEQITPDETPELAAAARKTLERRGDEATGWSMAWKVNFWARLWDGDHAWKLLKRLFSLNSTNRNGSGSYPNMFDAHPPFQIDGNFGAAAGIAQMLVQSREGLVRLLPALPKAWSSEGSVRGLKVVGGATIDLAWKDGKVTSYNLHGPHSKNLKVVVGSQR